MVFDQIHIKPLVLFARMDAGDFVLVKHSDVDLHPVLGTRVTSTDIYTRTIVMWAVGIELDIDLLWNNLRVLDEHGGEVTENRTYPVFTRDDKGSERPRSGARGSPKQFEPTSQPVVRMVKCSKQMRGHVKKRIHSKPFKSVLSVDIQSGIRMPNLKISKQNTIQITGCCRMSLLDAILSHLTTTYQGLGVTITDPSAAGFLCDIVLSNVFFKMPVSKGCGKLNRAKVCTAFNECNDRPKAIATFEPLLNDASVSVKFFDNERPNLGYIYPLWSQDSVAQQNGWRVLNETGFRTILPSVTPKDRPICHTFRVFSSGSVVQVGRWPQSMTRQQSQVELVIQSVSASDQQTSDQAESPRDRPSRKLEDITEDSHSRIQSQQQQSVRFQNLKQNNLLLWLRREGGCR